MDINVQMLALVGALSQKESPEWRRAIRRIESDAALPSEEKQFATMAEMRAFASNFK